MEIEGGRILVVGGAGLIGSHLVEKLTKEDVREIVVYDNFCRGTHENLKEALKDPRVRVFDIGGDICQVDILNAAIKQMDYVFHLAALWLLQCHDFPRAALRDLCELILEITEADFEIQYEPAGQTFVTHRFGSTEKARTDLGFEAKVDLREGLKRLIEWRRYYNRSLQETGGQQSQLEGVACW